MQTSPLAVRAPTWLIVVCVAVLSVTRMPAQLPSQLYAEAAQAYESGDLPAAKHKLQLVLQIDKNFRPASELLNRINLAQQQTKATGNAGGAPLPMKTLEQTAFPVEFKDTSLQTALEFIRQQTEEKTSGRAQINFVLQLPAELANKKITLRLSHVPVTEMLHYIGDLAGVKFQTQTYAIVVVPAASSGEAPGPVGSPPP